MFCVRIASLEALPSRTPHALFKLMHLYEILCSLHWRFPELRLRIGVENARVWATRSAHVGHAGRGQAVCRGACASCTPAGCFGGAYLRTSCTGCARGAYAMREAGHTRACGGHGIGGAREVAAMAGYRHREKSSYCLLGSTIFGPGMAMACSCDLVSTRNTNHSYTRHS